MKIGDLVKFKPNQSFVPNKLPYPPSGIIVSVARSQGIRSLIYHVLWANGSYTNEYACYLEVLNESR